MPPIVSRIDAFLAICRWLLGQNRRNEDVAVNTQETGEFPRVVEMLSRLDYMNECLRCPPTESIDR